MATFAEQERIEAILARLKAASWKERDAVKEELLAAAQETTDRVSLIEFLEGAKKDLSLELRWEVEEVVEALTPPPEPDPDYDDPDAEEEDEAGGDPRQLRMSDLSLVYDDPRGLMVYKHKVQDRWFAVQPDPNTGQPRMFELHPSEVQQLKAQLKGSPYWVLGAEG